MTAPFQARNTPHADRPDTALAARVAHMLEATPVAWRRVAGGLTPAERWVVTLADGRTAFAKVGTAEWVCDALRVEERFYAAVAAPYLPRLLGWDDDGARPILLLEDLSAAFWPPPWTPERIAAVRAAQTRSLRVTLAWAVRSLGLPAPDGE